MHAIVAGSVLDILTKWLRMKENEACLLGYLQCESLISKDPQRSEGKENTLSRVCLT